MTHPTLEQCRQARIGPGLPDTPEERARFESYVLAAGVAYDKYVSPDCYEDPDVWMAYRVWRDRGQLAQTALAEHTQLNSDSIFARIQALNQRDAARAEADQLRAKVESLESNLGYWRSLFAKRDIEASIAQAIIEKGVNYKREWVFIEHYQDWHEKLYELVSEAARLRGEAVCVKE